MSKKNFKKQYGEWALIVGASTGFGEAWANECAARGMNVIVCARRLNKLQEVTAKIRERYGVETREFVVDISDDAACDTILENIAGLDIGFCIFNAAVEHVGDFILVDEKYHEQQIRGNAMTPMKLTWHLCRDMAKKNRGAILLCSSMAGAICDPYNSVYGGVKSFELSLAEGLWYEMKQYGVTVAGVMIGEIATPEYYRVKESLGQDVEDQKNASTPEEAAAYVMDQFGKSPILYTSKHDERTYKLLMYLPRAKAVTIMGDTMAKNFNSGYDLLDDEFTKIK